MTLPKRRKWAKADILNGYQIRSTGHLQWIRGHCCSVQNTACQGRIEAAHVRCSLDGGMGLKPGDDWTISLCSYHHMQQHQVGEREFEKIHKIDMQTLAAEFWRKSPHRLKHESKLQQQSQSEAPARSPFLSPSLSTQGKK